MGTHPIFESDFDCLTEHGLDSNAFIKMGQLLSLEGSDNSGLQSVSEVLSLWRRNNDSLEGPLEMIWWIGIWVLFSSIMLHLFAVVISIIGLYKHSQARWYSLVLLINGLIFPLTVGLLTSSVISGVYHSVGWRMNPIIAFLWGVGQTLILLTVSMCRLLCTL